MIRPVKNSNLKRTWRTVYRSAELRFLDWGCVKRNNTVTSGMAYADRPVKNPGVCLDESDDAAAKLLHAYRVLLGENKLMAALCLARTCISVSATLDFADVHSTLTVGMTFKIVSESSYVPWYDLY